MDPTLDTILSQLPQHAFASGERIFEQGTTSGRLYFLVAGEVDVCRDNVPIATVRRPGAVLGEMSYLLDSPHIGDVTAAGEAVLARVDDPAAFLAEHPDVNLHIAKTLARRLDLLSRYLVDLKQQFGEQEDHLGMVDEVLDSLLCHGHDNEAPPATP